MKSINISVLTATLMTSFSAMALPPPQPQQAALTVQDVIKNVDYQGAVGTALTGTAQANAAAYRERAISQVPLVGAETALNTSGIQSATRVIRKADGSLWLIP